MFMTSSSRRILSYLPVLLFSLTLAACSDSNNTDPALTASENTAADPIANPTTPSGDEGDIVGDDDPTPATPSTPATPAITAPDEQPDTETTPPTDTVSPEPAPEPVTPPAQPLVTENPDTNVDNNPTPVVEGDLAPATATGSDTTGSDDDSPTATETASLAGPFIKDANRGAGPPSVPEGLTLLMAGENFVEFSWLPSTDDQSVEAYEIYRDGNLVYTIRYDNPFEFSYRNWISTSYIDCNYTRFAECNANPVVPGSTYQYQVAAIDNEGMKSSLSAPVSFQMAQRQSGGPDLTGYVQVFDEEFDSETLDRKYWKTALPWGPDKIINAEKQYFVNLFGSDPIDANPFVMTGSSLQITGTVTPPELLSQANNQPYLSGVISTKDKFEMTYGYIEMSAKLAGGQGFLSTFYLFNQDFQKNKPEIDVVEYIGDRPDKLYQTYHYHDSNRNRRGDGERHSTPTMESVLGYNLSEGFHKFSVLWEPGLIVWYVDGNEVRRLTGVRVSDEPMNIIAQLVVGSEWIGEPDPSALPKTFEIDYIKAWQKR